MDSNLVYQDDPRTELREELLDGKAVMMSPAAINHTVISGNIYHIFANYLKGKKCTPLADGALVYLTERDHFVPDMMIVCERNKLKPDGVHGAPDLVVEVLSPSTAKNDRSHKMEVYARCGVREYWIVSPEEKSVEVYWGEEGKFTLAALYSVYPEWMLERMKEEERAAVVTSFQCSLYDDLDISLDDIFGGLVS